MSVVAREWGLSDTWLRNICHRHNVPIPQRGYWQRRRSGQELHPAPLPPGSDDEIDIGIRSPRHDAINRPIRATDTTAITAHPPIAAKHEPRAVADDIALEMALLERDAQFMLRHQALEGALADLGAALVATSDLDLDACRAWLRRLQAEVRLRTPQANTLQWAMRRFGGRRGVSR